MTTLRIATFNVENLFARYNFRKNFTPTADGFSINNLAFDLYDEDAKKLTAKVIKEMDADVVCLQEVENMEVLERFVSRYLGGKGYKHRMLIDSHEMRRMDVAVLSKLPIIATKTHRQERNRNNSSWLFSRDCLQVTVEKDGKFLTLFNNHFKSMMYGRDDTKPRRKEQVDRVAQIITDTYGDDYDGNFVVMGDFNDYRDDNTSLSSLIDHSGLVDVTKGMSEDDKWTHYWAGGGEYKQIDFILLGKKLAEHNNGVKPQMMREGLPHRAEKYTGNRFDDVGENEPKASDHCGVFMDIKLI